MHVRVLCVFIVLAASSDIWAAPNQINATVCAAIIEAQSTTAVDALLHERVFAPQLRAYASNYSSFPAIGSDTGYVLRKVSALDLPMSPGYAPHADWAVTGMLLLNSDVGGGDVLLPRQHARYAPRCGLLLLFPNAYTHPVLVDDVRIGQMHFIIMWYRSK